MAEPAVEQSWQGCEPPGTELKSAQKWNCAARKIMPSNKAQMRARWGLRNIFLIRRSLGWNGCGVKQRNRMGGNFLHLFRGLARQRCYATGEGHATG
jgi:hypothetical protein